MDSAPPNATIPSEPGRRVAVDSALVPASSFADLNTVIRDTCNKFSRTTGWALTFQRAEGQLAEDLEGRLRQDEHCYWHSPVRSGFSTIGLMSIVRGREQLPEDRAKISDSPFLKSRLRRLVFPLPDACDAAEIIVNLINKIATRSQVLELSDAAVTSARNFTPNAQHRLDVLRFLSGFEAIALFLADDGDVKLTATSGIAKDQVPLPERSPQLSTTDFLSINGQQIAVEQPNELLPAQVNSAICVPLDRRNRQIGVVWFYSRSELSELPSELVEQAVTLAGRFSGALEDLVISKIDKDHTELQREMRLLGQIQKASECVDAPMDSRLEYSYFTQGATEVNGDLCEHISLDAHRTFFAIGDACGHGLPAAVITSTVRGCLRCMVLEQRVPEDLSELLQIIGNAINTTTPTYMFMTLLIGVIDTQANSLRYANAGHTSPILLQPDGHASRLDGTGLLLGVMENADYSDSEIEFPPSSLLVAFSDGITEARNDEKELFLHDGVLNAVRDVNCDQLTTDELVSIVLETAKSHSGNKFPDDTSLMVMRHRSPSA